MYTVPMIAAVVIPCLMVLSGPLAAAAAPADPAGVVIAVEGKVQVTGAGTTRDLRLKDTVSRGECVRTAPGAKVKLFFESSEVMATIDEDSAVEISDYHLKGDGGPFRAVFSLTRGRVRMDIERIFGKSVEVRTPNAIAGAKGTSFSVVFGGEATSLFVFKGVVSLTSTEGSLLVEGNRWSSVRGASPPAQPQPMTPEMTRENRIEMRARGSVAAATLFSNEKPRERRNERDTLNQVRTLSQDPQTRAMSQSGAVIKTGSFSVSAPSAPAAPPAPKPPPPRSSGPSRPSGQHDGGGGGPF